MTTPVRPAADRCPGVLRPHRAEDGLVVRLRIPGGQTTSGVLVALAELAAEFGSPAQGGTLQLTSRGNVQLRGIDEARLVELTDRVSDLGLLPSPAHDRVRNIVASPLTGLTAERPDLRPFVRELDRAICAEPELAELPGRFLFAVDDGGGDVALLDFDLAYLATDPDRGWLLLGGDQPRGRPVTVRVAVPQMVSLALEFVRSRDAAGSSSWRIWEAPPFRPDLCPVTRPTGAGPVRLGTVAGAASVSVPLAFLTPVQAEAVDRVAAGGVVVITPWRGLVIPGAAGFLEHLAEHGLVTDPLNAWSMISACVGTPGCAKSRIDTGAAARFLAGQSAAGPVHISGCERRCGAPRAEHLDLVAPIDLDQALLRRVAGR